MFKIATIALFATADVEASSHLKDATKAVSHTAAHAAKSAKKAAKAFTKWAKSGVSAGYDITPGSLPQAGLKGTAPWTDLHTCQACVANLGSWTAGVGSAAGSCAEAHKGEKDIDIEDWFTAAAQCTDTLNLCQIAGAPHTKTAQYTADATGHGYTLTDKGSVTLGWSTTAAGSTKVP